MVPKIKGFKTFDSFKLKKRISNIGLNHFKKNVYNNSGITRVTGKLQKGFYSRSITTDRITISNNVVYANTVAVKKSIYNNVNKLENIIKKEIIDIMTMYLNNLT